MGVRGNQTGVTLVFYNPDGTPDVTKRPVTGEYSAFYSITRPVDPNSNDVHLGSPEWLTDIMVVDNPTKLGNMVPTQSGILLTSAASQQVLVRWDVGAQRGTQVECVTISQGPVIDNHLFANTVHVLPRNTVMDENNDLWDEWLVAGHALTLQEKTPASTAATQKGGPASSKKEKKP